MNQPSPSGGLAIIFGQDEFVFVGIVSVQEGNFFNGAWKGGRWLNGDQTHQGRHIRLDTGKFSIQRVKSYRYR